MKLSNSMKKFFAYVCAIAMVVSSMAFYGQTSVEASGSAAVEGKIYTVTDGDATIVGFTCQGIFDKARIHFAWGTEVDAASITTTVNGKSVKIDGTNAHGMFIPSWAEFPNRRQLLRWQESGRPHDRSSSIHFPPYPYASPRPV